MIRNYQENTLFRIMFNVKMGVVKFNFFHFVINESFWVAYFEEPWFLFILMFKPYNLSKLTIIISILFPWISQVCCWCIDSELAPDVWLTSKHNLSGHEWKRWYEVFLNIRGCYFNGNKLGDDTPFLSIAKNRYIFAEFMIELVALLSKT